MTQVNDPQPEQDSEFPPGPDPPSPGTALGHGAEADWYRTDENQDPSGRGPQSASNDDEPTPGLSLRKFVTGVGTALLLAALGLSPWRLFSEFGWARRLQFELFDEQYFTVFVFFTATVLNAIAALLLMRILSRTPSHFLLIRIMLGIATAFILLSMLMHGACTVFVATPLPLGK